MDRCRPDVILSDLEMPGEDGYSLIRKIRERPADQGGTVPAAALTAYARTEDRLHSLRAGFHRHVPKPVQPDELAEIVASLAGRRRSLGADAQSPAPRPTVGAGRAGVGDESR